MNKVCLKGVLKNIQESHTIQNMNFQSAQLIVPTDKGTEDVINIKFKSFSNKYKENDIIAITGNLRSYSYRADDTHNRVQLYVFTYFDQPEDVIVENEVQIDGRICKINPLRTAKNKTRNIHFILANNIIVENSSKRLNSYIPCIAWGAQADKISELSVNSKVAIKGYIHSREHKVTNHLGEIELRLVHELVVDDVEVIK